MSDGIFISEDHKKAINEALSLKDESLRQVELMVSHQQKKIDLLTKAVKKLKDCRAFYGDRDNYMDIYWDSYGLTEENSKSTIGNFARTTAKDQDVIDALKLIGEK